MQFGAKPLFENVSVKFGAGNRYGLIGANGCGKSTFMKILGGDLDPSGGQVMLEPNVRLGKLRQDQFAYEEFTVLDTVIMGHEELWKVKAERDRIYSLPEMSEEDGMAVAELETEFAEMDGYTAESRAGELLLGLGIPLEQHFGPMSEVSPGWKLRVLLAQALFSDPEVLLLDEPTNHLDINTIRWLENILTQRSSLMIIISHDRHFLNSVCTHMADLDYGELRLFPGNYDEYMTVATQSREQHAQLPAWRHFAHRAEVLLDADTQAQQQFTGTGFGGVAVHFGELGFQLGHGHAVFFAHFWQRVDAIALGFDLPPLFVTHDHGVDHGKFFVGELILAQLTQAHVRLQHDLAAGRVEIATEDFHEGRLAATVGTDQTITVTGAELDRDVLKQRLGAELHGDVSCGDQLLYLSIAWGALIWAGTHSEPGPTGMRQQRHQGVKPSRRAENMGCMLEFGAHCRICAA